MAGVPRQRRPGATHGQGRPRSGQEEPQERSQLPPGRSAVPTMIEGDAGIHYQYLLANEAIECDKFEH